MGPRNKPTTTVLLNWLSVEPFQHGFSAMHASWERERTEAIWPTLEVISQHLWYHMGYKQVMGATILKGRQRTLGHKHQNPKMDSSHRGAMGDDSNTEKCNDSMQETNKLHFWKDFQETFHCDFQWRGKRNTALWPWWISTSSQSCSTNQRWLTQPWTTNWSS